MFVAHVDTRFAERVDEQRFEVVLREIAERGGRHRELLIALAFVGQAGDDVAAELGDPVHGAGVGRVLRVGADVVDVETDLAPDLEGARVDGVRRGRALWSVAAFHDQHGTTEPLEQQRGREADGPRAHDQHVDVEVFHQNSPAYEPPSRCRFWPEMYPACALHKNAHASPTSSGRPRRPAAIVAAISA